MSGTRADFGTEGFGVDPWGRGFFGLTTPTATLIGARIIRTNVIRVRFDSAVVANDRSYFRDATNPNNWTVAPTAGGPPFVVSRVDPGPGAGDVSAIEVDIWLLGNMQPGVAYTITPNAQIARAA